MFNWCSRKEKRLSLYCWTLESDLGFQALKLLLNKLILYFKLNNVIFLLSANVSLMLLFFSSMCMTYFSINSTSYLTPETQGGEVYFGSWFYRVQCMACWLQGKNSMVERPGGGKLWLGSREKRRSRDNTPFQIIAWWSTSSKWSPH